MDEQEKQARLAAAAEFHAVFDAVMAECGWLDGNHLKCADGSWVHILSVPANPEDKGIPTEWVVREVWTESADGLTWTQCMGASR